MKRCCTCHQYKPLKEFWNDKSIVDGKARQCMVCGKKKYKNAYVPHPRVLLSTEQLKIRANLRGLRYYYANKDKVCFRNQRRNRVIKNEVLGHYSGSGKPHCLYCNIDDLDVLCIDHIGGGGGKHRLTMRGAHFYRWLKQEGYPEGYQTLCANCNLKKKIQEGK